MLALPAISNAMRSLCGGTGFYMELATADEYSSFEAFVEHVSAIEVGETIGPDHVRHVICRNGRRTR